MLGAIVGDIIGSPYEGRRTRTKDYGFDLFSSVSTFTDDTVCTVAVAEWILNGGSLADWFHDYVDRYPQAGYGESFFNWCLQRAQEPYNSWGNGSAMRVSPVGWARDSLKETLKLAKGSAQVTHDHPEGVLGAQAVAGCIFVARRGGSKEDIRQFVEEWIGYDLTSSLEEIRPEYQFDVSCAGSVPESIIAFLESDDFESAVRGAVSLGGDADTMAAVAGSIAEAYYGGVPRHLAEEALTRLDDDLFEVVAAFRERFELP